MVGSGAVTEARSKCPACRRELTRPARFCYWCGAFLIHGPGTKAVLAPPSPQDGPTRSCPRCSYPYPRLGNFCANCGLRINENPLTREEASQRRRQAKLDKLTPDQRDRGVIRHNVLLLVTGIAILVAGVAWMVISPGTNSAYLGPLLTGLLLSLAAGFRQIRQARGRMRARHQEPASTTGTPKSA